MPATYRMNCAKFYLVQLALFLLLIHVRPFASFQFTLHVLQHGSTRARSFRTASKSATLRSTYLQSQARNTPMKQPHGTNLEGDDTNSKHACNRQTVELQARNVVSSFVDSFYNDDNDLKAISNCFDYAIEFMDTSFYKPIIGKDALIQSFEQSPTLLLHVHGTLPQLRNLKFVSGDAIVYVGKGQDIKIAMLYEYTTSSGASKEVANDGTMDGKWRYGITIFTVSDGFISQVFDVKEGNELDASVLRAGNVPGVIASRNNDLVSKRVSVADSNEDGVDLVSKFVEARNEKNVNALSALMGGDCVAHGFIADGASQQMASYFENLAKLPNGVTFETMDVVSTIHDDGTNEAVIRWVIAVESQPQRHSRGCTYVSVKNNRIAFLVDILESVKQEKNTGGGWKLSASRQNWLRDSGVSNAVFDALVVSSFPSILRENEPKAIFRFVKLTRRKLHLNYGSHPSQIVDLFLPHDLSKRRGLVFFIHGGAWGTGKPWMYRLIASTFLDANMAVAILGYRTYPDGNIQDQMDDIELASQKIATNYRNLLEQPQGVSSEDWMGSTLVGHSSGVHIGLAAIVQQIERQQVDTKNNESIKFDSVVGISGVYSINEHFELEVSRGVEEISSMKAAAGFTVESFQSFSPAVRLASLPSFEELQQHELFPRTLLLHGDEDDVVPFTALYRTGRLLRSLGCKNLDTNIMKLDHTDPLYHIMFGGQTRNVVMNWLKSRNEVG
uniref:BD-FAE-like domain-containing protein n=1 Tax=Leptocylindrus danicus TaxID=163516 RepID=A0A7S2KE63_9STRA|mmetsp:Transcript_21826/g.32678  ORF Transcript_21826/g.32678 Transcript_21826/m.32678 type:complete len:728 (+) Transcript_21826:129-2312(+)